MALELRRHFTWRLDCKPRAQCTSHMSLCRVWRTSRIVSFVGRLVVGWRTNHEELGRNGIDNLFVERRSLVWGSHDVADGLWMRGELLKFVLAKMVTLTIGWFLIGEIETTNAKASITMTVVNIVKDCWCGARETLWWGRPLLWKLQGKWPLVFYQDSNILLEFRVLYMDMVRDIICMCCLWLTTAKDYHIEWSNITI